MRWFGKNKKEKPEKGKPATLPELPRLPELPKISNKSMNISNEPISQLPSYPSSSFGEKFSQDAIKEAVTGGKGDEGVFNADDSFDRVEKRMMQKPQKILTQEIPLETTQRNLQTSRTLEPVFVRIDKFEESLEIFDKTKDKVSEIEKLLNDMRMINEKEERELQNWEREIQIIKKNFDKIDKDIFSKI